MTAVSSALLIGFHDGLMELVTPTANFTPATGDFGLANLKDSRLFHRCRTPDLTTDRQLTWDMGAAVQFNVFALMGSNATTAATRRFRAADDSGFTTGVVESGGSLAAAFDTSLGSLLTYAPPWGRTLIYVHSADVTKRYIRWHQTDSGNADGFQEWGIARVGLGWQPGITFDHSWRSANPIEGDPGAQKIRRGRELTLHRLLLAEVTKVESLVRGILGTRRVLIIPEPLAPATWLSEALWCVIEGDVDVRPVPGSSPTKRYFTVTITFREVDE